MSFFPSLCLGSLLLQVISNQYTATTFAATQNESKLRLKPPHLFSGADIGKFLRKRFADKKMLAAKKLIKIVVWLTQKINHHEAVIICHYRRSLIKIPISIKELGDKLIKLGGKFSRDRVHFK